MTDNHMTDDDATRLRAIHAADPDDLENMIHEYYRDADRAERTPRSILYLHLGMLCGRIAKLKTFARPCDIAAADAQRDKGQS